MAATAPVPAAEVNRLLQPLGAAQVGADELARGIAELRSALDDDA